MMADSTSFGPAVVVAAVGTELVLAFQLPDCNFMSKPPGSTTACSRLESIAASVTGEAARVF